MSESRLTESLNKHIALPEKSHWEESVDAMQNYLHLVKKHAEMESEAAEEQTAEHEEALKMLKKKRRERRNYGTRTGIVLEDGTNTRFED